MKRNKVDDESALAELAEVALASLEFEHQEHKTAAEFDPFEVYASHLKAHLFPDTEAFANRFVQGYTVLLEQIDKNEK